MAILPEAWVLGLNRHRFRPKSREPRRRLESKFVIYAIGNFDGAHIP
jgi:hypothetical protein